MIKSVKGPVTIEIWIGKRTKVVHSNRLQHCYVSGQRDTIKLNIQQMKLTIMSGPLPLWNTSSFHQLNKMCKITTLKDREDHLIATDHKLCGQA